MSCGRFGRSGRLFRGPEAGGIIILSIRPARLREKEPAPFGTTCDEIILVPLGIVKQPSGPSVSQSYTRFFRGKPSHGAGRSRPPDRPRPSGRQLRLNAVPAGKQQSQTDQLANRVQVRPLQSARAKYATDHGYAGGVRGTCRPSVRRRTTRETMRIAQGPRRVLRDHERQQDRVAALQALDGQVSSPAQADDPVHGGEPGAHIYDYDAMTRRRNMAGADLPDGMKQDRPAGGAALIVARPRVRSSRPVKSAKSEIKLIDPPPPVGPVRLRRGHEPSATRRAVRSETA